jgi:hypothetical protein
MEITSEMLFEELKDNVIEYTYNIIQLGAGCNECSLFLACKPPFDNVEKDTGDAMVLCNPDNDYEVLRIITGYRGKESGN